MNDLRDSGICKKLVRDSGSRPPLPDPVYITPVETTVESSFDFECDVE